MQIYHLLASNKYGESLLHIESIKVNETQKKRIYFFGNYDTTNH